MKLRDWWMPDAQQQAFRALLDACARPGKQAVFGDGALPLLLATLVDESVTLADPDHLLDPNQRRLLLAPDATVQDARFILCDGRRAPQPGFAPPLGTLDAPEGGATIVLTVQALQPQPQPQPQSQSQSQSHQQPAVTLLLRGPGVDGSARLHVTGLHTDWLLQRAHWVSAFPLGVDLVLCSPDRVAVLPRTTCIELEQD